MVEMHNFVDGPPAILLPAVNNEFVPSLSCRITIPFDNERHAGLHAWKSSRGESHPDRVTVLLSKDAPIQLLICNGLECKPISRRRIQQLGMVEKCRGHTLLD